MKKNDIQINGNVIGGRQGWAYVCNSMRFTILKVDLDREQEYDDYKTFDKVRVAEMRDGKIEYGMDGILECENGKWSIGGWGFGIHSSFGFHDMNELIERSNRQVVREGEIVALAFFSKTYEVATLSLYRIGKVDMFCQTIARLIPLTDEEMEQVKADADRWCNR